jgi:hypothetical protein
VTFTILPVRYESSGHAAGELNKQMQEKISATIARRMDVPLQIILSPHLGPAVGASRNGVTVDARAGEEKIV